MRVLITGGTGFVGSHAAKALLRQGHHVRLLIRNPAKAERIFQRPAALLPELVIGDVANGASVRAAVDRCDAVVHCAALTPMNTSSGEDVATVNVEGTRAVIEGACARGVKTVVYVSSITAIFHTQPELMTADAPVTPSSHPYGRSKAEAELYVRQLQDQGHPVVTVYPGGVLGPDDPGLSAASMALRYRLTESFRITSSGAQQVDVRDLAAAIAVLLTNTTGPGRYLTAGHFLTWPEIADLLERISGCTLRRVRSSGPYLRTLGRAVDLLRKVRPIQSPISAETMRYATQWPPMQNSPELAGLGVRFRDPAETFRDTLIWMCEAGHLDRTVVPRLFDA